MHKGRNLLQSGFVEDVQDNFIDSANEYVVRAHAQHSMKNLLPLNVALKISNTSGFVKYATFDCKASSLGRCAHVAAVLLLFSDTVSNTGTIMEPSTSKPCTWNKGKKRSKTPKPLHLTEYKSSKRKKPDLLYNWDLRPEKYQSLYVTSKMKV